MGRGREMATVNDETVQPRYVEIRRALEGKIISGAWPPGHRVPSERELVEEYGCSRMTVSKALSTLTAAGLIVRKRRAGSFVAARTSEETVLAIHDIKAEALGNGKPYRHEMLTRRTRTATPQDAVRFAVHPPSEVLALLVRHFSGDLPLVIEDRLINLDAVPRARTEDFARTPPGSWLLERIPWTEAEHVVSAVAADATVAAQLGIEKRSACLVMERRTWQVDTPVTAVRLTYPGNRHRLVGRFSPAST